MKQPKYIARVIYRETMYVNADGTALAQQPTEMESILDAFKPVYERRFMFVELYSNLGEVAGNTITGMVEHYFAQTGHVPHDVVLYFTRKAGKPHQSYPVGQTWLPTALVG